MFRFTSYFICGDADGVAQFFGNCIIMYTYQTDESQNRLKMFPVQSLITVDFCRAAGIHIVTVNNVVVHIVR